MNQFDKNKIITFRMNDIKSIQSALKEYQELLTKGEAFYDRCFDVEFKIETESGIRRLYAGDVKDTSILEYILTMVPGEDFGDSPWTRDKIKDDDKIYISEQIFFAIALEYEELKSEIGDCAKAMVTAMRYFNNTDEVWVNDRRLFGVDALYLIARKYPDYSYLLAQYFIIDWDHEHVNRYEFYLF
jgi:hypothetical protein